MSAIEQRHGSGLAPVGARQLGSRVKPIIRLGMGVKVEGARRDGTTYTRPEKTDHFTVRGDERAVAKFKGVYGEQPKAVKLMVPSSLPLALDISYRSFVGGGEDPEGGRPLALGLTNFAPLGYVGGPDVLRVWRQDGTYSEVETLGLDEQGKPLDEIANDLNIEVYTTFTFTIPDVLGWGSFCQVTSKGKKSADNLTFKLTEIYSAFGAKAPWAFTREDPPLLVLKPDSALTRFEDRSTGKASWGKVKIFVLDVVIPEPFEAMQDRILERQRELHGQGGPAEVMYGRPALTEGSPEVTPPADAVAEGRGGGSEVAEDTAAPLTGPGSAAGPGSAPSPDEDPSIGFGDTPSGVAPEPEPETPGRDEALAAAAAEYVPPSGKYAAGGKEGPLTLAEILAVNEGWFAWALKNVTAPAEYVQAVDLFARVRVPAVWQEIQAAKETAQ